MKTHSKTIQTMMSKTKFVLLAFLVAFSFSCSPEDGNDGAPGPQGPAGSDGQDGNANVISSGWIEFDTAVWTPLTDEFGIDYRNYPITVSEISQDIVDNGTVLVYTRFVITGTQNYMLPYTENITGTDPDGQIVSFRYSMNDLTIKMRNVSGSGDPDTFGGPGIAEYRYIIIPASGSGKTSNLNYSKMTYEEVINHFNLEL